MCFSSCIGYGLSLAPGSLNPELHPTVSLSLRQKQSLYYSLGQLVRSGVPVPSALESLSRSTSGGMRNLVRRLKENIGKGETVGESFARLRPAVGEMEVGVISAVERAGRLDQGLAQLSEYFGALDRARMSIRKKSAYPLFILHFGVVVLPLSTLFFGGGLKAYLRETLGFFALFYGIALVIVLLLPLLRDAGASSAALDRVLRLFPMFGSIREALATSRFCATYEMQLNAGINVLDALKAAQLASRSGLIRAAVAVAIPEVRSGAQVGPLLAASGAFPAPMIEAFCVGEQTGALDRELQRMADEYQTIGLSRLEALAEWLPRFFYILILCYMGFRIIMWYKHYLEFALSGGGLLN
jgi:type II secretory pathway component PulF